MKEELMVNWFALLELKRKWIKISWRNLWKIEKLIVMWKKFDMDFKLDCDMECGFASPPEFTVPPPPLPPYLKELPKCSEESSSEFEMCNLIPVSHQIEFCVRTEQKNRFFPSAFISEWELTRWEQTRQEKESHNSVSRTWRESLYSREWKAKFIAPEKNPIIIFMLIHFHRQPKYFYVRLCDKKLTRMFVFDVIIKFALHICDWSGAGAW